MKRVLDVWLAGVALSVTAPLMVVIGFLTRFTLGGEIYWGQRRIGLCEQPFTIWKFRTMREILDSSGRPLPDHCRLTSTGRWLRGMSFDRSEERRVGEECRS